MNRSSQRLYVSGHTSIGYGNEHRLKNPEDGFPLSIGNLYGDVMLYTRLEKRDSGRYLLRCHISTVTFPLFQSCFRLCKTESLFPIGTSFILPTSYTYYKVPGWRHSALQTPQSKAILPPERCSIPLCTSTHHKTKSGPQYKEIIGNASITAIYRRKLHVPRPHTCLGPDTV